MIAQWSGEIVGNLHNAGITHKALAERLGWHEKYLSAVLNGRRAPKNAESKVRCALDEMIRERAGCERR